MPIAAQRVPRLSRSERGDARCHSLTRGSLAVVSRSFGSASILALACTNRTYAVGLKLDVQRATALFVVRPLRFVAHEVVAEDYFRGRIHFYLLAWTSMSEFSDIEASHMIMHTGLETHRNRDRDV